MHTVCAHLCVRTHVCIYLRVRVCARMFCAYTYKYIHSGTHTHIHTYVHTLEYSLALAYIYAMFTQCSTRHRACFVRIHIYIYTYRYTHTYTYIYTYTWILTCIRLRNSVRDIASCLQNISNDPHVQILRIKNRLSPDYNAAELSGGYRDVALNLILITPETQRLGSSIYVWIYVCFIHTYMSTCATQNLILITTTSFLSPPRPCA